MLSSIDGLQKLTDAKLKEILLEVTGRRIKIYCLQYVVQ